MRPRTALSMLALASVALAGLSAPAAANEPPSASFTFSPSAPDVGDDVTLEATAGDPDGEIVAYEWWVDGEQVGTGATATVTMDVGGDVTVRLTVTDDDGATTDASRTVEVSGDTGGLTVSIDVEPTRPATGTPVTFRAEAVPLASSYVWNFPDGSTSSSSVTSYTFTTAGTRTVEVVATDDDERATASVDVEVRDADPGAPTASIRFAPDEPDVGDRVRLVATADDRDGTVERYEWRVDGEVVATGQDVHHSFDAAGDHEVTLTVVDNENETGTATATVPVAATNTRPTATIDYDPLVPSAGEEVTLTANADDPDGTIARYEWRVDGRTVGDGASITHVFEDAGDATVGLTVTDDAGASVSTETSISVGEPAGDGDDGSGGGGDDGGSGGNGGEGLPGFGAVVAAFAVAGGTWLRRTG